MMLYVQHGTGLSVILSIYTLAQKSTQQLFTTLEILNYCYYKRSKFIMAALNY